MRRKPPKIGTKLRAKQLADQGPKSNCLMSDGTYYRNNAGAPLENNDMEFGMDYWAWSCIRLDGPSRIFSNGEDFFLTDHPEIGKYRVFTISPSGDIEESWHSYEWNEWND